mgnify:CR=1 FL=1
MRAQGDGVRAGPARTLPAAARRSARRRRGGGETAWLLWLLLPALVVMLVCFVTPLGVMLARSLTDPSPANYLKFFDSAVYPQALAYTLGMALAVTLLCVLLGYPFAYLMHRCGPGWRMLLTLVVLLPFWSSLLVRTYAWTILLRDTGLINWVLLESGLVDKPVRLMGNSIGVLIGMTHIMLPFLVLPLYAGMQRIDDRLVVAAASMGAAQRTIFRRVFLPLSLPGLAAGSLLVFALSVGFYVTPALLGGRTAFYTLLIDMQVNRLLDFGFGSTLAIILLLVVLLIVGLGSRLVRLDQVFGRPGGA